MQLSINKTKCIYFVAIYFDTPVHDNSRFCSKFAQAANFDLAVDLVKDWASREGLPNIHRMTGKESLLQNINKFPFPREVLS